MNIAIIIISILIIIIVLLQAGASEGAGFLTGNNSSDLFKNRKERGGELFITRTTIVLGTVYFVLCVIL